MREIRRRKISSKKWSHKYPRTRIKNRGNEKLAGWYNGWWERTMIDYNTIKKFLIENVGRPVDKVYSEFLKRLRKGTYVKRESLKSFFFSFFKDKEEVKHWKNFGGFYLSNGIINYIPTKSYLWNPHYPTNFTLTLEQMMPYIKLLECTNKPVYIGDFFIDKTTNKTQVYIGYKSGYLERYTGYRQVEVSGYSKEFQISPMRVSYIPFTIIGKELVPSGLGHLDKAPTYIFLIKSNRKKSLTKK